MVITTVASGAFMWAVHLFSKVIPHTEYGVLGTMLALINWVTIPSLGLQMVFAQQASLALTEERQRELAAATRAVGKGVFALWLVGAGLLAWRQNELAQLWQIANPLALWRG